MEDAIYKKAPVCIHEIVHKEVESVWPDGIFVVDPAHSGSSGMLDLFQAGRCKPIANSMLEVRSRPDLMDRMCQNNLVSTGSLVLENPIAFPASERLAGGLSYWLFIFGGKSGYYL